MSFIISITIQSAIARGIIRMIDTNSVNCYNLTKKSNFRSVLWKGEGVYYGLTKKIISM